MAIAVNEAVTLRVGKGKDFWTGELLNSDGTPALIEADMPEADVPNDSKDAELITVYVIRALIRAAQSNRVTHPLLKK